MPPTKDIQKETDAVGDHHETAVVKVEDHRNDQKSGLLNFAVKFGVGAALIFWGFPYVLTQWSETQKKAAETAAELQKESQKFMQQQMLSISERLGGGLAQASANFEATAENVEEFKEEIQDFSGQIADFTETQKVANAQQAELVESLKPLKTIVNRLGDISDQLPPAVEAVSETTPPETP